MNSEFEKEISIKKMELLDPKTIEKFGSHLKYILLECNECERTWGVNVYDNEVRTDQIICQACAVKKITQEM